MALAPKFAQFQKVEEHVCHNSLVNTQSQPIVELGIVAFHALGKCAPNLRSTYLE